MFVNMKDKLCFPGKVVKDIVITMVDMMCSNDPMSAGNQLPNRNRKKENDPMEYHPSPNSKALTIKEILNEISGMVAYTEPSSEDTESMTIWSVWSWL